MMKTTIGKVKKSYLIFTVYLVVMGVAGVAKSGHGDNAHDPSSHKAMSHETMNQASAMEGFSHEAVVDGIRAEFQVMSLAQMKMKDPDGNTHHVMVRFFNHPTKKQIKNAIGKIKIITPSGKEQVATLKDYSGVYAGNFTVQEKGKYGIICLFKIEDRKHLVKFWYEAG